MNTFFNASAFFYLVEGAQTFGGSACNVLATLGKKHPKLGFIARMLMIKKGREISGSSDTVIGVLIRFNDLFLLLQVHFPA